jgi:DNA-binding CsgD family transcriptional regulator
MSPATDARLGRLLRAAEMAFELGRRDLAGRILDGVDPASVPRHDQARILWIREFTDPAEIGHVDRIRTLVEAAQGVIENGDTDLALNLLWAAQLRLWRADAGSEIRLHLVAVTESVPVPEDDARVLAILAAAAPTERGTIVLERLRRKDPRSESDPAAQRFLGMASTTVGDFVLAEAFLAPAVVALRAQGRLAVLAQALNLHAWTALHTRSLDLAAAHAEESGRLARETGQALWGAGADVTLVHVAGMRGTEAEVEMLAASAARDLSHTRGGDVLADLQMARGVAALCRGGHAEAYAHLRRIYEPSDPAFHPGHQTWAIGDFIEAAAQSGHLTEARRVMAAMEVLAADTPSPRFQLAMARARPWVADDAEVDRLYSAAIVADLAGWPFIRGRIHLAYGEWLRRHRRVVDARDQLRIAREVFDAYGAVLWGDRARGELRAAGEASRQRAPDAFDQLTPQELQIARLAAKGLSNREIGEQLYLSHRTIGFHLYHVFPKLGVTSRAELAGALEGSAAVA